MKKRFGNVLNSVESVVPLLEKQLYRVAPLRYASEATRYFMSIPEACQLIMEASSVGMGAKYCFGYGEPVSMAFWLNK